MAAIPPNKVHGFSLAAGVSDALCVRLCGTGGGNEQNNTTNVHQK